MGWKWYDFSLLFNDNFRKLPNIKKYHHFRFSSKDIGKVYVSEKSGSLEISKE